ncbi:MAG: diacylglycerol/lipid kinase family protein [Terriglobales bacterium]
MRAAAILGKTASPYDLRPFESAGVTIDVLPDLPPASNPKLKLETETPFDAALIFGGDGSLHRQLPAAIASQTPVLCVPTGSGNDFSRAIGIAARADALAAWQKSTSGAANIRSVDVAQITPTRGSGLAARYYACIAGAGLDSEVNRRANAMPAWLRAHGGYVLALPPTLWSFQAPHVTVELFDSDGPARISEPAMLVAFANAPSYGDGMRMAPRAQLDDGRLDLCFVRRTSKLRLLRLFPVVFSGGHLRLPEVIYARCSGLRIEADRPLDIFGDGEFICQTPAEVRMKPRALRVIVP